VSRLTDCPHYFYYNQQNNFCQVFFKKYMLNKFFSFLFPVDKIFRSPPVIETARMTLSKITVADAYDMHVYASREDVTRYLTWEPHVTLDETREYIEHLERQYAAGKFFDWGIRHREDERFIGTIGFTSFDFFRKKVEIGYVLSPFYWGRALMNEALSAVIDYAGSLGFKTIEARYIDGNERSRRVMESCGMKFLRTKPNSLFVKGEWKTVHVMQLRVDS